MVDEAAISLKVVMKEGGGRRKTERGGRLGDVDDVGMGAEMEWSGGGLKEWAP